MAATAHGTTTAGEVEEVEITGHDGCVEIINRSMTGTLWVTFDGSDPEVEGAGSYIVLGARRFEHLPAIDTATLTVKLLAGASAELDYSVEGAL